MKKLGYFLKGKTLLFLISFNSFLSSKISLIKETSLAKDSSQDFLSSSLEINRNIMCSTNPQKSWRDWMINGIKPEKAKECKNNGDTNTDFSRSKVIQSTPTTIFKNGTRKSGLMDAEMLKKEIEARK